MHTRITKKTIAFSKPFRIAAFDEVLPAGKYTVETEEELLEGSLMPAYRRIATRLHVRNSPGLTRIRNVDPNDLDIAMRSEIEN